MIPRYLPFLGGPGVVLVEVFAHGLDISEGALELAEEDVQVGVLGLFLQTRQRREVGVDAYRLAQAMNLALDVGLVVPEVEDIKASFPSRRRAAAPATTPAPAANGKP